MYVNWLAIVRRKVAQVWSHFRIIIGSFVVCANKEKHLLNSRKQIWFVFLAIDAQ